MFAIIGETMCVEWKYYVHVFFQWQYREGGVRASTEGALENLRSFCISLFGAILDYEMQEESASESEWGGGAKKHGILIRTFL